MDSIQLGKEVREATEAAQQPHFDRQFWPGQDGLLPKSGDRVPVNGEQLIWHQAEANKFYLDLALAQRPDRNRNPDDSLFCGVAYVVCESELPKVRLAIGSDDSSIWRINGKEVIRVYASRGSEPDQNVSDPLTLRSGLNVLSFRVINGNGGTSARARFLDKDDNPVIDISVTLSPPPVGGK